MAENESQSSTNITEQKPKRRYVRHQPQQIQNPAPKINQNIVALESGIIPLVNQRLETNQKLAIATAKANQANVELASIREELQRVESEIQYRMNLIGQLKNGGAPVPQTPYIIPRSAKP